MFKKRERPNLDFDPDFIGYERNKLAMDISTGRPIDPKFSRPEYQERFAHILNDPVLRAEGIEYQAHAFVLKSVRCVLDGEKK